MIRRLYARLLRLFRRRKMTYAETIRRMKPVAYYPLSERDRDVHRYGL
jgi:hypothetical protein